MKIPAKNERQTAVAANPEIAWRRLTEALIFAAADYGDPRTGTITWIRILDRTGRPYNQANAERRCRELHGVIQREFAHLPYDVLKAHAANDSQTFRYQYGHLLPKRPDVAVPGRKTMSHEDRQRSMENAF
jgi:hypothetical protein